MLNLSYLAFKYISSKAKYILKSENFHGRWTQFACCTQSAVFSLHFVPSLHSAVCGLQSAFCTHRIPNTLGKFSQSSRIVCRPSCFRLWFVFNLGQNKVQRLCRISPKSMMEARRSKTPPFWHHWIGGGVVSFILSKIVGSKPIT